MNRLLRLPDVVAHTGLSAGTIRRMVRERIFPAPTRISQRAVAWPMDELTAWQNARIAASRSAASRPTNPLI